MAATSRAEMTGSDGSQYVYSGSNGHRGHNPSSLGSSFFRESHEGRTQTSGVCSGGRGVPAGNAVSSHVELPPLSQVLMLETIHLVEQKFARQAELRRAINAAVGSSTDDPSLGSVQAKSLESLGIEELKRVKASISENSSRARERSRHLAEATVKLEKYFTVLQSRKRSRSDTPVHERPLMSLAAESPTSAPHLTKANLSGAPGHSGPVDPTARLADKTKAVNINKRLRTSVADVRVEGRLTNQSMARSASFADREKDFQRPNGTLSSGMEDKGRPVLSPGDLWEKSKLKGRRSGIKQDSAVSTVQIGSLEGEREHKWSGQHRLGQDSRPRANEGHGLRSGPVHGITSIHKAETSLHMNGLAPRPVSKVETDGAVSNSDRTERSLGIDRERTLSKSGAKPSSQEEVHSSSPTTITKGKAARAPRSNSVAPGNSSHQARVASFGDRERPSATLSKIQVPSSQTNRKRQAPSRSSSPPVAQWVGQRPQKIARVARRVNLMPPVGPPPNDDAANGLFDGNVNRDGAAAAGPRSNAGIVSGSGVVRRLSVSGMASPKQSKTRNERVNSSLIISESEESEEATDSRLKEKLKKHGDWETKPLPAVQKVDNMILPAKKMQVEVKEEVGDGVRRQGRSGRTSSAPKRLHVAMPVEEIDTSATAKQLRSTKVEKPERMGRAVVKNRTLDRKPLTRPRRPTGNSAGDLSGESDDDRDELVNAAQAAVSASALACSSDFWKQIESYFAYLTADDMSFLRNQVDLKLTAKSSYPSSVEATEVPLPFANGNLGIDGGFGKGSSKARGSSQDLHTGGKLNVSGGWLEKTFPLSQRLLAALISETQQLDNCGHLEESSQGNAVQPLGDAFISSKPVKNMNADFKSKKLDFDESHHMEKYGDVVKHEPGIANGHIFIVDSLDETDDILVQVKPELLNRVNKHATDNHDAISMHTGSSTREDGDCGNNCSAIHKPGMAAWELQYEGMSLDDRIRLELQSIGIIVQQVPDLAQKEEEEDIGVEMSKLRRKLDDKACSNKHRIQALEQAIMTRKEAEERDRENLAMMKLVEIAYNKRKGYRGGASSNVGSKSSGPKGARAAAMAFAKRTLTRLQKFEAGQSCFADPTLRGILFSTALRESEGTEVAHNATKEEESGTLAVKDVTFSRMKLAEGGVLAASEEAGMPDLPLSDGQEKVAAEFEHNPPEVASASRSKGKDVLSMRDITTLGDKVFGGTKGKRSERDRDGKSQGKEMFIKNPSDGRARHATGNIKGERKTKTKPRQKTAPLFKAMNGLLGMPAELPRDVSSVSASVQDRVEKNAITKEVEINTADGTLEPSMSGAIDLSHLQIPDDLGVADGLGPTQDLGSWFDFEDANLQDGHDELLVGLAVPMDDLADLGMTSF